MSTQSQDIQKNTIGSDLKDDEEIKSFKELKKPMSEKAKEARGKNSEKAREGLKVKKEQDKIDKEQEKLQRERQIQLLEDLKKKYDEPSKKSDSESDGEDEDIKPSVKETKKKSRMFNNNDEELKYISETVRNMEKRLDKLYTMKKMKIKNTMPNQTIINPAPAPITYVNEDKITRRDYLNRIMVNSSKRI